MRNKLYGDGINDDAAAIQEMLDTGTSEVRLPPPAVRYMIGRTLKIHSNQSLILPRFAAIRLMDGVSRPMIENAGFKVGDENIRVSGGVWDMNNVGQAPNPIYNLEFKKYYDVETAVNPNPYFPDVYLGVGMRFANIKNLELSDLTYKDPVTFCTEMAHLDGFTVEKIIFDFNQGNPYPLNMDGIHLEGHCRHGVIRDLKGTCYDDLVALNADELCRGPIEDIVIENIMAENCHSAVRLLSSCSPVRRINISRVFGTYYQYCVAFSKYFRKGDGNPGVYEDIAIKDCCVSKAERNVDFYKNSYVYPLFWFESETYSKNVTFRDISRVEKTTDVPMIRLEKDAKIENLTFDNVRQESELFPELVLVDNLGEIVNGYL